jgi:hypothetical protein
MKLISWLNVATAIVIWLVLAGLSFSVLDISWPIRLLVLGGLAVFMGLSDWMLWLAIRPPVLRADARQVTCNSTFDRQRMQRSDLAFIFRGQARAQRGGSWAKSYIFSAADGRVGISCSPLIFTPEGMAQFAQRLQIPIRGDFSKQVTDRVDPATT